MRLFWSIFPSPGPGETHAWRALDVSLLTNHHIDMNGSLLGCSVLENKCAWGGNRLKNTGTRVPRTRNAKECFRWLSCCDFHQQTCWSLLFRCRIHTGDRPYKCAHPGCEKAFTQLSNLQVCKNSSLLMLMVLLLG